MQHIRYNPHDPKYICSYCHLRASPTLGVHSIKNTFWFDIMPETPKNGNICNLCLKPVLKEVLNLKRKPLDQCNKLRDKLLECKINQQYLDVRESLHIIQKLYTVSKKRRSDSNIGSNESKRQKLDVSHESGNTTTLCFVRGSLVGGGLLCRTAPRVAPYSPEQSSDFNTQSETSLVQELPRPGTDIPINDDESSTSEDGESSSSEDFSSDNDDSSEIYVPSSAAPFQVPRMRSPHEDGLRLNGA